MRHTTNAAARWMSTLFAMALASCASAPLEGGFYFAGYVRDGVSGEVIPGYLIELAWLDETMRGEVGDDGRYLIGPLAEYHDYTVRIRADGFRPFVSHNAMRATAPSDGLQSFLFDAYLYPTDLRSPETQVSAFFDDSEQRPTGQVRLRPSTLSLLIDDPAETPSGVPGQVWENDEDLLNATVLLPLEGGEAIVPDGALVYGVTYDVAVLGVPGYQVREGGRLTAGVTSFATLVLSQFVDPPLELVFNSAELGPVGRDAVRVVLLFNQDVALDPTADAAAWSEILDDGVSLATGDEDADGVTNQLRDDASAMAQERGTSLTITGNRVVLEWSDAGLDTADADDPIRAVTFARLDQLGIRPAGGGVATYTDLGAFAGSSVSVVIAP